VCLIFKSPNFNSLANSLEDLDEIGELLVIVLGETSSVVDSEQKFLSKCMHIKEVDESTTPPQLSEQMRSALRPIFDQLPESFRAFSRACANKGHL
jgi:hypothetical protein